MVLVVVGGSVVVAAGAARKHRWDDCPREHWRLILPSGTRTA